ncbi:putative proton-dependent oligopeptide transporter family, major facilitator superfamily [Helianthus annuus]|uniref:Proton-dependent oligopeptide transporter family, major facilitator superfamily n=1 Tax=Helianthus annuus TaxID=4232 RepID=A0A251UWH2_HELAN|nr:protein NRT1/ PTR FAMILY 1.2 [Helianthus annuus]KAF5808058.1 putative proton-dependent oligopeptide transporter family, major facilitator superfamily [Helianthus annuus]
MEIHSIEEESEMTQEKSSRIRKGGFRTLPFILANESFEKVASYGLLPNMIIYLLVDYHMSFTKGTNIILIWSAATNFLPIVGAFLADSFLGRFLTIFLGSIISLMGMILLWLTTMIRDVKPPLCDPRNPSTCKSPTPIQYTLLYSAFAFMSIGAGGVRPCSLAFGADQIDTKDVTKRERRLESFFGWYYSMAIMGVMIAITAIVYIQDHHGWRVGFGIPVILMFISTLSFVVAYPLYYKMKVEKSLFTSLCQVIYVAWKNRRIELPNSVDGSWYNKNDANVTKPTDNLRFLNKACTLSIAHNTTDAIAKDQWIVCTVDQVEELKALIKVIPLWSSCIMLSVANSQTTFPVLQARAMDRHITSGFEIPAASFSFFTIVSIMVWVILYDRAILPLLSEIQGKPVYISVKLRMGAGLVCSIVALVISAIVEHVRKNKAIENGFLNNPQGVISMSALWLIPQHVLSGLADALNIIGQNEFYYTEFPKSMSSVAMALYMLGAAFASLLASLLLSTVNDLTKGHGKDSWVSTNINKAQYEKYYWLLGVMSCINLLYYVVCSWRYRSSVGKTVVEGNKTSDPGVELGSTS